jgi:predicted CXXCH cytochrome family protein
LVLFVAPPARADDRVINSKHDLSTFGPGPVRALHESEVCIFCHTPHNASPAAPLWNRTNPQTYYRIYQSSTTKANIGQPTGPSKLCLSCHDGSIALGMVLSRPEPIPLTHPFIPTGPSDLTNDLSDDHPIGFRYDRQLSNRDRQLRSPDFVDHRIRLGSLGELECTACHDPHNNELGDFLRLPMRQGTLCNTCHQMAGWHAASHALSPKHVPPSLTYGERLPFATLADNACNACHVMHGAEQPERLLRDRPYDLCIDCHDGLVGQNILAVIGQRAAHRPGRFLDRHDPAEDPRTMPAHVECVDCHNPHAARPNPFATAAALNRGAGPLYMPAMEEMPGITLAGLPTERAKFYYEVCFRCHDDNPVPLPNRIVRQVDTRGNVRREFLPTAASAHPVTFAQRPDSDVPSLMPEQRSNPYMSCQSCHNNPDARQFGGSQPNGPHGSPYEFLLVADYETADFTTESPQAYALCYQCHDRNSILADESFSLHSRHIVRDRTPCSACHTAHGVSGGTTQHSHLINFDISIVGGQRLYVDTGRFSGSCTLVCHGVQHVNFRYGP